MKLFFYIIYPLFFFAMGCGIYVAFRDAEGLVDNNYYENSKRYFQAKATEERLGIAITTPGALKKGENKIQVTVTSQGRPLERADITLFIGNLSTAGYDSTIAMLEEAPGIYEGTADIPFKGVWFTRIDLKQQKQLITSKKWFSDIR